MNCPNCGNTKFERLDYAVIRCKSCLSLFDPYVHPDFSEPSVDVGESWDTLSEEDDEDW